MIKSSFKVKNFEELSLQELYDIMHLRQIVFVVEQNTAYLDADRKDMRSKHIFLYIENKMVAYARVIPKGISYKEASIGRLVSDPNFRRKKLGRLLMQKCIEVLKNDWNTTKCRISAQSYLVPFYKEFDFEVCSEEYLEDGLPHFEMLKT